MKFNPPRWLLGSLLVPLALIMIFVCCGIGTVLSMGGSEGTELSRALLLNGQPSAAFDAGQGQPGFYTRLLSLLFEVFGPHPATARVFSLLSIIVMLVAIGWLFRRTTGFAGMLFFGVLLFSANGILNLSMTALPGLVAVSWAIVAVAIGYEPDQPPNWKRHLPSGVIWACAVLINPTVLMLWPAFVVLCGRQWGWKATGSSLVIWGIGFGAAFFLVTRLVSPALMAGSSPNQPFFHLNALLQNPGLLLAAIIGILLLVNRKCPDSLLFALVWLGSVAIQTALRGGCPEQDIVQIYVPLAILGSAGFTTAMAGAIGSFQERPSQNDKSTGIHYRSGLQALGAATVFAFWVGFAVPDFVSNLTRLNHLPSIHHDGLCFSISKYAPETRWCYTRFPEYAFAGDVVIPSELAAIPPPGPQNRIASWESILELVQHYQPEQLLLEANREMQNQVWATWTTNHYVLVDQDGEKQLWVSRRLHPDQVQSPNDFLRNLGL